MNTEEWPRKTKVKFIITILATIAIILVLSVISL